MFPPLCDILSVEQVESTVGEVFIEQPGPVRGGAGCRFHLRGDSKDRQTVLTVTASAIDAPPLGDKAPPDWAEAIRTFLNDGRPAPDYVGRVDGNLLFAEREDDASTQMVIKGLATGDPPHSNILIIAELHGSGTRRLAPRLPELLGRLARHVKGDNTS